MHIKLRCAVIATIATAVAAAAVHAFVGDILEPATDPAAGVTRLCTAALLTALLWGWAAVLAGVTDAWRRADRPGSKTGVDCGHGVRRLVLVACGVAVTGVLVAPVTQAAPAPDATTSSSVVGASVSVSAAVATRSTAPTRPDVRVVRRGDCLWSIAASEVQPGAGPATIAARWRAVYTANHGVIGDDPDLIHPGQHLRMPR